MSSLSIKTKLKTLPSKPGVYLFKDRHGKVIYVGKAASLRHRVKSYFSPGTTATPKLQQLVNNISDIESIIADTEQEALFLENNLIKKYQPHYNARLKDDKTFPYIKIELYDDWPAVKITRRLYKDGSRYFGPFANAGSVRKTLRLIKKIFPLRSCNRAITGKDTKPCLEYHINRCLGPCIATVSKQEYNKAVRQMMLFLEGKQELVIRDLKRKMEKASRQLRFERAAWYRDQIHDIKKVIEGQRIAVVVKGDQDVIAMAQDKDVAGVEVFFIRNNKLTGRDSRIMAGTQNEEPDQIMTSFVKQYYASASSIPPLILLQLPVAEPALIASWLSSQRGNTVRLRVPQRGAGRHLVEMVAENAKHGLALYQANREATLEPALALEELKEKLHLPSPPVRIECYDISNIRGNLATGSMTVLEQGTPRPAHYRRFKIKTVAGIDDYAMIQEMLRRRFQNYLAAEDKWATAPDLILIDGGKGHLNAAVKVIQELGLSSIHVASLAKENEEVFTTGASQPVDIPLTSAALHLLQRIRDEAHRFALGYHQKLRHKRSIASTLDNIPGIGPRRKRALLAKFGSVPRLREATVAEIATAEGINDRLAKIIKQSI